MNSKELFNADGTKAMVVECGKCRRIWNTSYAPIRGGKHGDRDWTPEERYEYARKQAERCCDWRCDICGEKAWSEFQTMCRKHLNESMDKTEAEKEAARFAKAKAYTGDPEDAILWLDGEERIYRGLTELLDHMEGDEAMPEYVWLAKEMPLEIDVDSVIENATCDHHETVSDAISAEDRGRLDKMLTEWCESIGACSYEPDYSQYLDLTKVVKGRG